VNRATGLVLDPAFADHLTGPGHPESPRRLAAIENALRQNDLLGRLRRIEPRLASDTDLLRCHTPDYLAILRRDLQTGALQLSTGDTPLSRRSGEIARLAAGGLLAAVDAVIGGTVINAFAAVRPPGHHACAGGGMGFCVFNSVAVAARYAQAVHGLERVLIVDWDVHHGNGTQEIFYGDPSVLVFNTHQWPLYPGTGAAGERGEGAGLGTTINCPFPAGTGGEGILEAYRQVLLPASAAFRPDLVLVSAGFDSRAGDPLGGFLLTDDDFAELTRMVMGIARSHCRGRLISSLEGGYDLRGLGSAAAAHVRTLIDADP
jgi:acetoin utilization deacetylase AcuC-like enzyme